MPQSLLGEPAIRYRWDDSNFYWVFEDIDSSFPSSISGLAEPAVCAFSIAISEWVFFRLAPLERDSDTMRFLEAAWCANIDRRYCEGLEVDRQGPLGPVKGPILAAKNIVNSALYESMESVEKPVLEPAQLSNLAEHVYGRSPEFQSWRRRCLDRLRTLYPELDPFQDLYGEATSTMRVPREAFDPDYPFTPDETPKLLNQLLRGVDYAVNPFLRSPQQLIEEGFEGIPYTYPPSRMANES